MPDPLAAIPLSAIRVIEAAARLGSFTRAAAELGMTQAAVSWQVKALEQRLDQPLFRRLPREVALTPAGERLARAATEAMTTLRAALGDLTDTGDTVLSVTTLHTFAQQWLAPRLGGFQLANPGLALRLDTETRMIDLRHEAMDVGIRTGLGDWPGLVAHRMFPSMMTILAPPQVVAALGPSPTPADVLAAPRVGTAEEWAQWFAAAGVAPPSESDEAQARRIAAAAQVLEVAAALANGAFAIASPVLFAAEIAAGRLVQPFEIYWATERDYWLVYPEERRRTRRIAAFRDWLLAQVDADPAAQQAIAARARLG
jgi:LysR family glycine cleavage system transcriptional activator